ncbi:hypothetical protein A4G28_16155 [Mycobacterium ostraviense]|uniref:Uncharacterized protein n=1 Tax=Mycobacterium ostraviense TaxID=2738409 RepID=A0A164DVT4_9MYCO|nr:hypothetical protein A4G28_16155 [Mycobacterium ostraviense]
MPSNRPQLMVVESFSVAALYRLGVFSASILNFAFCSRHRLVANSPDEELAGFEYSESTL